ADHHLDRVLLGAHSRTSGASGARRAAGPSTVASGLAGLLLEECQARQQIVHASARGLHALAQRLVLLLQIGDAVPHLGVGFRRHPCHARRPRPSAPDPALLQLGFGLEGARAPAGQLVRHMAENRLQLLEHPPINPNSVIRQARPPAPSAPAADAWAAADAAPPRARPPATGPRTRRAAPPRRARRPRAGPTTLPPLHRVAPPPSHPLPVARCTTGPRPLPLTQSGASSPI